MKRILQLLAIAVEKYFCVEAVSNNNSLIGFYTGFPSYELFLCFFEFLGPSTSSLQNWSDKDKLRVMSKHRRKLNPINKLFVTLTKTQLERTRPGPSIQCVFGNSIKLLHHMGMFSILSHERNNCMPDTTHLTSTSPVSFKESYKNTFAIIDATEIIILWKYRLIYSCIHQHGLTINITIQVRYLFLVPQMEQLALYHTCTWALYQMLNSLEFVGLLKCRMKREVSPLWQTMVSLLRTNLMQ